MPGRASDELRNECVKKDVRAREAGEAGEPATLARQNRMSPPPSSARLRRRNVIRSNAEAELQEKQADSGELAPAVPDVLPEQYE